MTIKFWSTVSKGFVKPTILIVIGTVIFGVFLGKINAEINDSNYQEKKVLAVAANSFPLIADDYNKKQVTVETEKIKAVFYYGGYNTAPNWEKEYQGGGNLYELYYKPTDKNKDHNLIAKWSSGTKNTSGIAVGVGGVGNTQAYFLNLDPTLDKRKPSCPASDAKCKTIPEDELLRLNDYISDNNSGYYLGHQVEKNKPKVNWTTVTFNFDVKARTTKSGLLFKDQPIYRVKKIWRISPSGNIFHQQKKTLEKNIWLAEVGFRMQWNMERDWNTLRKWGHVTNLANSKSLAKNLANRQTLERCLQGVDGYTSNSNSATCSAVSEYVTLKNLRSLKNKPSECFLPSGIYPTKDLILFQPTWLTIKGSPSAPDVRVVYDNSSTGFNGGGIWESLRYASQTQENYAYMEQCVHDRRVIGDGAYALHFGFFSSAGGNDPSDTSGKNFNLYCINASSNNCRGHVISSEGTDRNGIFIDTFIIRLKRSDDKAETSDANDSSGFTSDDIQDRYIFADTDI